MHGGERGGDPIPRPCSENPAVLKRGADVLTATHPAWSQDQSRDSRVADASRGVMFPRSRAPAVHQPTHALHRSPPPLPSCPAVPSVPADGQGLPRFVARKPQSCSRSHALGCWLVTSLLPTARTRLQMSELVQERATETTVGW